MCFQYVHSISVMRKLRNLPMTTREPVSNAKTREFFITKLERLRRGAPSFGLHCFYWEYSGERVKKGGVQAERLLIGYPLQ